MEKNYPKVLAFPGHRFNPFASYPRTKVGEIENNLTRAMFVGLKEVAERGLLSVFLGELFKKAVAPNPKAGARLDAVKDSVETSRVIHFKLLTAPTSVDLDRSKLLVLGVCGGAPEAKSEEKSEEWTVGERDGLTSIPDGVIVAGGAMIVFESKLPSGALDALQVARHLDRLGMLSLTEQAELENRLWKPTMWMEALSDRVLEVRWPAVIDLLKRYHKDSNSPALDTAVEYLSDCVCPLGTEDGLNKKVFRTREAVLGLLGTTGVESGSPVTILEAFHMEKEREKVTDQAILGMLNGDSASPGIGHAVIWREELKEATESVRPELEAMARKLDARLEGRGWSRDEGRRKTENVQGGYDPIDLHVRWKPEWAKKVGTNGSLVLGTDLFGTPWATGTEDSSPPTLYCTWHEQSNFVNWPTSRAKDRPTEEAINQKHREVTERIRCWARMWSARIDALPSDLCFDFLARSVRFKGNFIKWQGSTSAEFVWPERTYGGGQEPGCSTRDRDEALQILRSLEFGTADPRLFFFPSRDGFRKEPECDLRHSVRKPVISLSIDTYGKNIIEVVDGFARLIEDWGKDNRRSPDAFRKGSRPLYQQV